jgi:hypothetical protein
MNFAARLLGGMKRCWPFRRLHYSRDPVTGQKYSLPDEVRQAFVPVKNPNPEIKTALSEIGLVAAYAKAKGIESVCGGNFEGLLEEARAYSGKLDVSQVQQVELPTGKPRAIGCVDASDPQV